MINKVILVGNLGANPEVRYTQSGIAVATLSVATSRAWKDKDDNWQDETEWHRVILWGQAAERCNDSFAKGNKVYIEGRLQTRKWQDQSGNDRYSTEVVSAVLKNLMPRESDTPGPAQHNEGHGGHSSDDVPF